MSYTVEAACLGCGKPMQRLSTTVRDPWCKSCRPNRVCRVCGGPHHRKGFCGVHYYRFITHGDPLAEAKTPWSNRTHAVNRTAWELSRYGLTVERFQEMLEEQDGGCGICGRALTGRRLCIDHDHNCCPERAKSCGECVRGLLCPRCNSGLEEMWGRREVIGAWLRRSLRSVVCFDLDSTLASTVHRRYLIPEIQAGRATWDDYSLLCMKDAPIIGTVVLARLLWPSCLICIVSGRSVRAEDLTRGWLAQHAVPFDRLILRPDDEENGIFKVKQIRRLQEEGLSVELFVEDWGLAARQIQEETDVPVLGVNPFDEGSCTVTQDALAAALAAHPAYRNAAWVEPAELAADVFKQLGGA